MTTIKIKEDQQIPQKYVNISVTLNVLGCLLKQPSLLMDTRYKLTINDFPIGFHSMLFKCISNLVEEKHLSVLNLIDIDSYLSLRPNSYKIFNDNRGGEYVLQAQALAELDNFGYYYEELKKTALLNALSYNGFDTESILYSDPSKEIPPEMREKYDKMTAQDIMEKYDKSLCTIKEGYLNSNIAIKSKAGDGLLALIESFKEQPEIGLPLISPKLSTIYRGQRKKKFYLESAPQGVGKTRRMAGESAHLAIPKYYDNDLKKWVDSHIQPQNVLYISTELELNEVQTIWTAYVSGVSEEHILDAKYGPGEEARVKKACEMIDNANLYFVQISNYDIDDIENLIKEYHYQYQIDYVYYDYLSSTIKMMANTGKETKISGLREDQILLLFSERLKDLANQYDLFIWSASQLSGNWKVNKEADQQLLRGAKSLSDKIDNGSIILPVREDIDRQIIESCMTKGFGLEPTHVIHVYKIRRGHYNNIKVYVNFDRGTCRLKDCFVTDNLGNKLIIEDSTIDHVLDSTKDTDDLGEW